MKAKNLSVLAVLALSAILASSAAFADDSTGVSQATTTSLGFGDLLNHAYLDYFANFHGPSTGNFSSPYTVNNKGVESRLAFNALNFDSTLKAAYMVDSNLGVGAYIPFQLYPVLGEGITLGDLGATAFVPHAFTYNGLNVYADLILQAPTSGYSQSRNMKFSVKTTPNVRYSIPSTRFTVGSWSEIKAYLGVTKGTAFKLWAGPYANYRLLHNVSLNLMYEMEAHHDIGAPSKLDFTSYQTDLQPGVVWMITPKIMVNPYVQLFTGNKVTMDTSAVGAVINASVL